MTSAKKKKEKDLSLAKIFINATFNNTLLNVTDAKGNTIAWGSSGAVGFKGARKATPYAASTAIEAVVKKLSNSRIRDVEVYIKGPGAGRDSAIKALRGSGFNIKAIA